MLHVEIVFLFLASFSIKLVVAINNFPSVELQALKDLYYGTNGAHWKWKNSTLLFGIPWKVTEVNPNPCGERWQGVVCSSSCTTAVQCNVNQLQLSNHNLLGTIPSSIGNFTKLLYLDLSSNALHGTIPHSIGDLSQLNSLYIEINMLSGTIPPTVGKFTALTTFDVYNNMLHGTIPTEICNLHLLQYLYLQDNFFTGTLPDALYTAFPSLIFFRLDSNQFHGTISPLIQSFTQLQYCCLIDNMFSGPLPVDWSPMSNSLVYLNVDKNLFTSTLPSSLNTLHKLKYLTFSQNFINGTIPYNVSGLISLQQLIGYGNLLTGPLPPSMASWSSIVAINLATNYLFSSFPNTFFTNMKLLNQLIASENELYGTLPISFYCLPKIVEVNIAINIFFGTISPALGQLTSINVLIINNNFFDGTLPCRNFTTLTHLQMFLADTNYFDGTLCEEFSLLSNSMKNLILYHNSFYGTLPESLGNLVNLKVLYLQENLFTGTIPNSFGNCSNLQSLSLSENMLHGTIPETFHRLRELQQFQMDLNSFSGAMPVDSVISRMEQLEIFVFNQNFLTGNMFTELYFCGNYTNPALYLLDGFMNLLSGSIPFKPLCHEMNILNYLSLETNYFTGNIDVMQMWHGLTYVNVSENMFSGTIPAATFQSQNNLTQLVLAHNHFSGSVNSLFDSLPNLNILEISSNKFSGSLENIVNPTKQPQLSMVDISDNQFTGTLPPSLFQGNQLLSIAAVTNCLTGSIPIEVCANPTLQTLALDGLYTASRCQDLFFPRSAFDLFSSSSYELVQFLSGGIPSCLFNMTSLRSLHLSGNGLTGTIPANLPISPALTTLSLSYNQLSGSIPFTVQEKHWKYLDLSYNKLNGILKTSFAEVSNETTLILTVNRLSGNIPESIVSTTSNNVDILNGNLFACREGSIRQDGTAATSPDLPSHDRNAGTYSCGTNSINNSLYTWVATIGFCVILCGVYTAIGLLVPVQDGMESLTCILRRFWIWKHYSRSFLSNIFEWRNLYVTRPDWCSENIWKCFAEVGKQLNSFRRTTLCLTLFAIPVLLIIYSSLSTQYATHSYSYAWTLSIGYLSGFVPAIVIFVVMILFYFFIIELEYTVNTLAAIEDTKTERTEIVESEHVFSKRWFNASYEWFIVHRTHLLYGVFLIVLNIVVVLTVNVAYVYGTTLSLSNEQMTFMVIAISIFKIIWSHLVIQGILANYMKASFHAEGSDVQRVYFLSHIVIFNNIIAPLVADAFVDPNCFYHVIQAPSIVNVSSDFYLCGYYLISFHSKITCAGIVEFQTLFGYIPPFIYSFQCSSALLNDFITVFIYRYLFSGILGPVQLMVTTNDLYGKFIVACKKYWTPKESSKEPPTQQDTVELKSMSSQYENTINPINEAKLEGSVNVSVDSNPALISSLKRTFIPESFVVTFTGDIAVLVTFGWAFPPLAIVICYSMYTNSLFQQIWLARWWYHKKPLSQHHCDGELERVEVALFTLTKSLSLFRPMIPTLAFLSSSFMAFFLFDMLGDEVGAINALWIFILMSTMPGWLYAVHKFLKCSTNAVMPCWYDICFK